MLHPSPEEKVLSRVIPVVNVVLKIILVIAFVFFMLVTTGGIVFLMTPELDTHPWEVIKK